MSPGTGGSRVHGRVERDRRSTAEFIIYNLRDVTTAPYDGAQLTRTYLLIAALASSDTARACLVTWLLLVS